MKKNHTFLHIVCAVEFIIIVGLGIHSANLQFALQGQLSDSGYNEMYIPNSNEAQEPSEPGNFSTMPWPQEEPSEPGGFSVEDWPSEPGNFYSQPWPEPTEEDTVYCLLPICYDYVDFENNVHVEQTAGCVPMKRQDCEAYDSKITLYEDANKCNAFVSDYHLDYTRLRRN